MKITGIALICPPLAIVRYHTVAGTAGPIGVFWLAGLTSLFYGLTGGHTGEGTISWPLLWLGVFLWLTSAVWARLV
ncbi:MAG: hypothetical protein R3310_05960, partial [Candidatus Competibacteraceae bacterium]|nr:hypothetical protein [Candidatus Competibacteraceae bacterium]